MALKGRYSDPAMSSISLIVISAAGTADFAGAIVPKTDNAADLGAAGKRWSNIHVADGIVMTTPGGTGTYKVYVDNSVTIENIAAIAASRAFLFEKTIITIMPRVSEGSDGI